ncbi:MazG [Prochlorococcus phage MED4-213]|uniref:MazG n=1 Tax=Prochlorococcus phage MED4-213 TaxID=889956 RepID=M4QDN9_9CAUD|nr:MazG-like pyrophosphatase [Prochlorococcus phage MED4-213]AGH26283.1 MazG [Prochlorococcus phage MED4-213]
MKMTVDFKRYEKFVDAVTSDSSKDFVYLADRLVELDRKGANIERLTTSGVGLAAESGEFLEIVKKMVFQGKPWNDANREHLIIELGDVMWYVAQACMALEIDLDDVIKGNIKKLEKRYPGGKFDIGDSENRAADDL